MRLGESNNSNTTDKNTLGCSNNTTIDKNVLGCCNGKSK